MNSYSRRRRRRGGAGGILLIMLLAAAAALAVFLLRGGETPGGAALTDDTAQAGDAAPAGGQETAPAEDSEPQAVQTSTGVSCTLTDLGEEAIYTGELTAEGAAHPTAIFYTNTVDMDKDVDIGFSTYAEPSTMAGYVMSEGCQFDGLDGETEKAVREYIAGQSMDYFTELFRGADFPLKGDTFPESFSYETEGDIFFSIPVPHALGDYAIVKFTPDTK